MMEISFERKKSALSLPAGLVLFEEVQEKATRTPMPYSPIRLVEQENAESPKSIRTKLPL